LSRSDSSYETSETKSFRAGRSDRFFRRIYEQAGTGIAITDWLGVFQECNPAYCALLDYSEEELRSINFASLVHPDDREANLAQVRRLQAGEISSFDIENRYIHKNGAPVWVHKFVSVLPGENGEPAHLIALVTNTTGRHHAEEMLRASEANLQAANAFLDAIFENIPLMLFIKESRSLRFIRLNRISEGLLGWPNETLKGKNAYEYWPKEQAEFFIEKDRETLNSGSEIDIPEEPILTRYRGVRILHTKKVPILDATGNPIYLLGISEDITERKQFEKEQQFLADVSVALSASLEYEETLANLARLVVQNFADWCAVDVINGEWQLSRLKVASADPDQGALCAVLEQMPPDRGLPHLMRSVMESKRPIVVEQVTLQYFQSLAQAPRHLQALLDTGITSFVAVPLLMRGQALGALFLGSSTLSRVLGENYLRLAETLADRAAMAIENARLYRAAVRATQLRDQVLGVVAHDLRSPLSNILTQVWTLKHQGSEPERQPLKAAELIQRAATRMNRMIQDLLDVALMEAGQLSIEPSQLSAAGLIVEAVDMHRALTSSSARELQVELAPDLPEIWGDWDRLLQVFENLIGNAIKFTSTGGCITAGAALRDHDVVFRVADTGVGIAAENLPRIFDRFWRASKAGRHGAGLGLAITKAIVEAHGGRIWVESKAGSGSTFFFTIPTKPSQRRIDFPIAVTRPGASFCFQPYRYCGMQKDVPDRRSGFADC
jgi:PAS domain S-box-containing protein